jgi:RecA-family ATPase
MVIHDPGEVIKYINPELLTYEEWVSVGMAMKHEGAKAIDWEDWSRGDERYKDGECLSKWESFRGTGNPKTIATLVALAKAQGWTPPKDTGRALDWDEVIHFPKEDRKDQEQDDEYKVLDPNWIEVEELSEPGDEWNPVQDLSKYLDTVFDPDDIVGYVTDFWHDEENNRYHPRRVNYDRTAGKLIRELTKCRGDLGAVVGDVTSGAGAWIRFNPLDGEGAKDSNITSLRFALVESDEMPIPKQYALLKELELPIAAMIHSGGKSVHAVVRVDADTIEEYRKRVDFLYEVCGRNGLKLDRQNRNPGRSARMPGIMRKGRKQWLIGTNIGKSSWGEWEEWIVDLNDDLPDIEDLIITDEEPEVAPELIEGLLREGHKMLLSGPSKAHKSFALIQLAVSIAEGRSWFGWKTGRGRVLYVNLELDGRSCKHRYWATYKRAGISYTPGMIDIWNLRGSATSMDKLTPKLIRRAQKKGYKAVIIDPVYKVLTGDENSADQMAHFCNQFDKICLQLEAATIFCHHHSKGSQGQKQSQDRASGSGVFSRDPDTILDLIELYIDEDLRKQIVNQWECDAIRGFLDQDLTPGWHKLLSDEDLQDANKLFDWAAGQVERSRIAEVRLKARHNATLTTGWRMEATLREFPPIPTKTLFFKYPTHLLDSNGLLADAKAEGEDAAWLRKPMSSEARLKRRREVQERRNEEDNRMLEVALQSNYGEPVSVKEVAERMACTDKTVRNKVRNHPKYKIRNGLVIEIIDEMSDLINNS